MKKIRTPLIIFISIVALLLITYLVFHFLFVTDKPTSGNNDKNNIYEILNWKCTIVFGFVASILALSQAIFSTYQKFIERRWNKADLAMKLIDELYDVDLAHNALRMTDGVSQKYSEKLFYISHKDILTALKKLKDDSGDHPWDNSDKSVYIRDCYDTLFYYFERIEHSVNIGVVDFVDIKSFFAYYMQAIEIHKLLLVNYCKEIKYFEAISFIDRFSSASIKAQ